MTDRNEAHQVPLTHLPLTHNPLTHNPLTHSPFIHSPLIHNVEIAEKGHPLAMAEVSTEVGGDGITEAAFHAESGHLPPGTRSDLVDAVLDLTEVRASEHLRASVPIGDSESLNRLRERTAHMRTHAAGCTTLVDADIACDCADLDQRGGGRSSQREPLHQSD